MDVVPVARKRFAQIISDQCGSSACRVVESRDGWPSIMEVKTATSWVRIAAHLARIQSSMRGRESSERRGQNPGKGRPVTQPKGTLAVLMSVETSPDARWVLVGMDAAHRMGALTRQSLFVTLSALRTGSSTGWTEYFNATHERIVVFDPFLLPIYIEALQREEWPAAQDVEGLISSAGLLNASASAPDVAQVLESIRKLPWRGSKEEESGGPIQGSLLD